VFFEERGLSDEPLRRGVPQRRKKYSLRPLHKTMLSSESTITIRFSDCDPMGHANNASYFTFMEESRVILFQDTFPTPALDVDAATSYPFIIAEITCRFLAPTYANQKIIIKNRIAHIGNSSFTIEYDLLDAKTQKPVASGKSVQVWYDYKLKTSAPIPEKIKKLFS